MTRQSGSREKDRDRRGARSSRRERRDRNRSARRRRARRGVISGLVNRPRIRARSGRHCPLKRSGSGGCERLHALRRQRNRRRRNRDWLRRAHRHRDGRRFRLILLRRSGNSDAPCRRRRCKYTAGKSAGARRPIHTAVRRKIVDNRGEINHATHGNRSRPRINHHGNRCIRIRTAAASAASRHTKRHRNSKHQERQSSLSHQSAPFCEFADEAAPRGISERIGAPCSFLSM